MGQRLEFSLDNTGRVIIQPLTQDLRRLKGIIRNSRRPAPSLDEIVKAIRRGDARNRG
jgi:hypothetical protein